MGNSGDRDATDEPLSVMVVQLPHARDMPLPAYQSSQRGRDRPDGGGPGRAIR